MAELPSEKRTPMSSRMGSRAVEAESRFKSHAAAHDGSIKRSFATPRSLPRKLERRGSTSSLLPHGRIRSHTIERSSSSRAVVQASWLLFDSIQEDPLTARGTLDFPAPVAVGISRDPSEPSPLLSKSINKQTNAADHVDGSRSSAQSASIGKENTGPDSQRQGLVHRRHPKGTVPWDSDPRLFSVNGLMATSAPDDRSVSSAQSRKRKLRDTIATRQPTTASAVITHDTDSGHTGRFNPLTTLNSENTGKRRVNSIARQFDGLSEGSQVDSRHGSQYGRTRRSPPKLRFKHEPVERSRIET